MRKSDNRKSSRAVRFRLSDLACKIFFTLLFLNSFKNMLTPFKLVPGLGFFKRGRLFFRIGSGCVFLLLIGFIFYPVSPTSSSSEPRGEITQPENGSKISRTIVISGYTENIPPDRPYVIIAADVKNKNLSWPKKPVIKPNVRFLTTFYEGGSAGECVVSLYAVNDDLYKKIKQWFKEERLGGMPMLPDRFRLDSVSLDIF